MNTHYVYENELTFIDALKAWRRKWQPTLVLPGESHGQMCLMGYIPRGNKESDVPE